jgi:nucleotide-binding universal stress UspA family protein
MKFLVYVDTWTPEISPVEHVERAMRRGEKVEVVVLNVQRPFNQRVSRFTRRADRDALRAERSRTAMAGVIERLSRTGIPFRASTELGEPAERIAAVAEAVRADEILIGERRRAGWLRWLAPSAAQKIAAYTDVPVVVIARGRESGLERYVIPTAAGLAALVATLFLIVE